MFINKKMASGDSATSVRILNEDVDKLTKLPHMVKAFEELTNEEVILTAEIISDFVTQCGHPCQFSRVAVNSTHGQLDTRVNFKAI